MATLSPLTMFTRENAKDYPDVVTIKREAQIFTIQMEGKERIDVVADDDGVSVHYIDPLGFLNRQYLQILLPARANRFMLTAMHSYLENPYNWDHFQHRNFREWFDFFVDVGFQAREY